MTKLSIKTVGGETYVTKKCDITLFSETDTFFVLPSLTTFDAILGYTFLKRIGAEVDVGNDVLRFKKNEKRSVKPVHEEINYLEIDFSSVPFDTKSEFLEKIKRNQCAFEEPNRILP